jgi:alpha-ketoglutarate-dependent taurine dioxygenase
MLTQPAPCFCLELPLPWWGLGLIGEQEEKQIELEGLEAICSLTHHDYKIYRLTHNDQLPPADEGPLVAEAVRWANPPRRAPIVLTHPETGKKCLYGLNGSTCAIVKKGSAVTEVSLRKQHRPLFCDAI